MLQKSLPIIYSTSQRRMISLVPKMSDIKNGILGGDDYLRTGIPNSRFTLTKDPSCSLEDTLDNLLSRHRQTDPFKAVDKDLRSVGESLKELVGSDHPVVHAAARHFFDVAGKRFRPTMVLLMSRALSLGHKSSSLSLTSSESLLPTQRRLSEITEMIHTASLLHDDVIDDADTRRNIPSVNAAYGNKIAILGGDFLLARASVALAKLRHPDVILLMSTVIEHLVKGEVMQMNSASSCGLQETIDYYLTKSFYKTASLMANSCQSAAVLAGHDEKMQEIAYDFGTHLGLSFQIVDDMLDLQQSSDALGKPSQKDIQLGLATAPVLYAADEFPELKPIIASKFKGPNDIETTLRCVARSKALERSRELAVFHAAQAAAAVAELNPSQAQSALFSIIDRTLNRSK